MAGSEILLARGRYRARLATTEADIAAAQKLRSLCFATSDIDRDVFDSRCTHVVVEEITSGDLVCCFRLMLLEGGRDLERSYSAQYYDLQGLGDFKGRMVEMGRFCIHPDSPDPDILRIAWGAMTDFVDANEVQMLFGCSSFAGTSTRHYLDSFAMLRERHLAPCRWLPRIKAPHVFRYAAKLRRRPDAKRAMLRMPPLLRTYLMMGGWVSDHAVIDCKMNTLHVFTGLEIGAIPDTRKRLLRAVAEGS